MENSVKAIIIGASIAITMVIVSIGFYILRQGQDVAENASKNFSEINAEMAESKYTIYDENTISGSEVVNVVKKFKNENIAIGVSTKASSDFTWYIYKATIGSDDIVDSLDDTTTSINTMISSGNKYVNPNAQFLGKVYRDANDVIAAIKFIQQ